MKTDAVVRQLFLAAICVFIAALNKVHGQIEIYAGPSENRFSLFRDSASATGYEFGGRYGVRSWLALDAGYTDFGKVNSAFSVVAVLPPGFTLVTTGILSGPLHVDARVDARAVYLLPEFRCSFGSLLSGSLGVGLARFESKIGSNEFYEVPVPVGGPALLPTWLPTYSGTRRSWTGIGRASLRAVVSRSWTAEASVHFTSAPAITADYALGADIGNRRLQVLGGTVDLIWRFPAK